MRECGVGLLPALRIFSMLHQSLSHLEGRADEVR